MCVCERERVAGDKSERMLEGERRRERGEKSTRITGVESLSIMILGREKESEERYFGE